MSEDIRVMIVDDIDETRSNIKQLLAFYSEVTVVGDVGNAKQAIEMAKDLQPDVILMDVNMPDMDGIKATEIISQEVPFASIIIISVQSEQEYLRRAMIAGAKNYLTKPFASDELLQAVKQAYYNEQKRKKHVVEIDTNEQKSGKVIALFSTKGGVGKTTIATNLAVALALKTGTKVALVDADLQFGDISLFLNILPNRTIFDLLKDIDHLDAETVDSHMVDFQNLVKVLAAPFRPEQSEMITGAHLTKIIKTLQDSFDYIVIDTAPTFQETMLAVLDAADHVLVVAVTDLPTIKNVKICLEVIESLEYNPEKIKLILNRAQSDSGLDLKEVEESLRNCFSAALPSDGKTVVAAVNRGIPFVISNPQTAVSQGVFAIARSLASNDWEEVEPQSTITSKLKRLFS